MTLVIQRSLDGSTGWADISGTNDVATYLLLSGDSGYYLRVKETYGGVVAYSSVIGPITGGGGALNNGAGYWKASNKTWTGVQQAYGVEWGYGAEQTGSEITPANYPNAGVRMYYKHCGVANPAGGTGAAFRNWINTLFTKEDLQANTTWIATTDGSTPVAAAVGNGVTGCLVGDFGYAPFLSASVTEILRWGNFVSGFVNEIFFDNVSGGTYGVLNQLPWNRAAGRAYTSIEWRSAVIAYYAALADALKGIGIKLTVNASDYYDPALGETPFDYSTTDTNRRFWGQLVSYVTNTSSIIHKDAFDHLFWEFFCQVADGADANKLKKRIIGNTDFKFFWAEYQGLIAYAHSLGRNFAYTATMDSSNIAGDSNNASYERASFLLDYNGAGDILWMWNVVDESASFSPSPNLFSNPGSPAAGAAGTHSITSGLHWRQFQNFIVIVNPTTASIGPVTVNGISRTVGATKAVFA